MEGVEPAPWKPPDSGSNAWYTVTYTFLADAIAFGILTSYGVVYVDLVSRYGFQGHADVSSTAALTGSLAYGMSYLLSPISGIVVDFLGHRSTAIIGGIVSTLGLLISSFVIDYPGALIVTFALMFGAGIPFQVVTGFSLLGLYFKRRVGLVNGIACSGSAIFGAILPYLVKLLKYKLGLPTIFQIFAAMSIILPLLSVAIKTPVGYVKKTSEASIFRKLIHVENFKNHKFLTWCATFLLAWFGFYIPYVHLVKYASLQFPGYNGETLITCLNLSSIFSQIALGIVGDIPKINKITIQQICVIINGIVLILIPLTTNWSFLIVLALLIGLTNGGFITLMAPIAFEICGLEGGTQALGFKMGFSAIPLIAGPPFAGWLFDLTKSYTTPFIIAGSLTVFSAIAMTLVYFMPDKPISQSNDTDNIIAT